MVRPEPGFWKCQSIPAHAAHPCPVWWTWRARHRACFDTGGSNYNVPVPGAAGALSGKDPLAAFEDDLSRTIVDCEVNADQWTLMHRYNKAADLLEQILQV
jgi:hypothetical protein